MNIDLLKELDVWIIKVEIFGTSQAEKKQPHRIIAAGFIIVTFY